MSQEVSKDLLDKVQATKALVTVHSLLGVGMFQIRHQDQLKQSMDFITELHKQVLEECLLHPESDLVEDLVEFRKEKERQESLQKLMDEQVNKESHE